MISKLLPHHTNRRLVAVMLAKGIRGRAALRQRLVVENWRTYRAYRNFRFSCNVCATEGHPFFDFPNLELRQEHGIGVLRETLQCRQCGATMRHRTLAAALLMAITERGGQQLRAICDITPAAFGDMRVLDTDAFSPISRLLHRLTGYTVSSFMPNKPFDTEIAPRHINLNLEKMGLAAGSFDVVMTSDVMEHVRNVNAAHDEIARILKPGGSYVFTVPYDPTIDYHKVLVDTSGAEDVYIVPPHLHGDPLSGGILAYRIFGRQLFADLEACGFKTEFVCVDEPASLIVQGDVFIARKFAGPSASNQKNHSREAT